MSLLDGIIRGPGRDSVGTAQDFGSLAVNFFNINQLVSAASDFLHQAGDQIGLSLGGHIGIAPVIVSRAGHMNPIAISGLDHLWYAVAVGLKGMVVGWT